MNLLDANNIAFQLQINVERMSDAHQAIFKRMYSPDNLKLSIESIVDNMPDETLEHALRQSERSVDNLSKSI